MASLKDLTLAEIVLERQRLGLLGQDAGYDIALFVAGQYDLLRSI